MTNPRKFSEKIALHNQKQAEETAAFEEIMREVMGATRPVPNETYRNQQHLHITPSFNATRAGSLPNVNQIGQHNSDNSTDKDTCIDLQSALNNLQEIKNGCFERSGSVRAESYSSRRNVSPLSRSPHRNSSNNVAYNVNNLPFINSVLQKRSQSPYSTNNNAYLSPPPPDGHWRRTNSDSALHQSTLLSASTNQTLDSFQQMADNTPMNSGNNNSPRRSSAMVIDNSTSPNLMNNMSNTSGNMINGNVLAWDDQTKNNSQDKFLLSASLPDQQLRPRSCEVPGINIYPSQDDNNSADSIANHHHIPISSNTGSLPDLTNLHFPVPLHTPIDSDDQNGIQNAIMNIGATPNSPYSNGPDSPFSPTSSHNSNLSPPPPCNMMGNYSPSNQSPRRQTSPGPSPSPTATRRRPHHNVNNLVIGNHRHQPQPQVCCYSRPHTPPPQPLPQNIPPAPNYLTEPNHHYSSQYQSPPKITLEGLALDTNTLSLNGNGAQYKSTNIGNLTSQNNSIPANSDSSIYTNASDSASFQQQQFQFNNTQSFQNFATMDMHRSTTPTDSCSAPTSPISQSLSPSNSPELPMNCNGGASNVSNKQQYNNSYNSYSNHQANILHQQLEQFRMTNDSDANNYMMSCNTNLASPLDSGEQNSNVFYLSSSNNTSISNVALNQYADSVISQQNNNELPSSPHQISCQTSVFSNDNIYYSSSQISSLQNMPNNTSNLVYIKSDAPNHVDTMNNLYSNHQLSNSSHCTTPQTPTSIPDIILTGPNNLDELQSTTDFVKDLNNTIVNLNNMGSFDSDIFCSASDDPLRAGSFDSFDLDSLQILPDIDPNTE